jgi:hypothetical protein
MRVKMLAKTASIDSEGFLKKIALAQKRGRVITHIGALSDESVRSAKRSTVFCPSFQKTNIKSNSELHQKVYEGRPNTSGSEGIQ